MISIILFIIIGIVIEVPTYYWVIVGIGVTLKIMRVIAELI